MQPMQPMHLRTRIWQPAFLAVLLTLLVAAMSPFIAYAAAQHRGCSWIVDEGSCSPPLLTSVLAVLLLAGSLVLAIRSLWRLFVPRTFAVIDHEGIRFDWWGIGLVPWSEIRGCDVSRYSRIVRLGVKDAAGKRDAWIARKPRLLRPFVRFLTMPVVLSVIFLEKRSTIFRIPAYGVDRRSAEIMETIRARLDGATFTPEGPDAAPARRSGIAARVTQAACLAVFAAGLALSATGLYIWLPGGDPLSAETRALVEELAAADQETPDAALQTLVRAGVEVDAAVNEMLDGMRTLGEHERTKARIMVWVVMAAGLVDSASSHAADLARFTDSSIDYPGEMTPAARDDLYLEAGADFLLLYAYFPYYGYDDYDEDDRYDGYADLGDMRGPLQELSWTLDHGQEVMAALAAMGGHAVPALAGALENEDSFVRTIAALLLVGAGPDAADVVPELARALENDHHTAVLHNVAAALGNIGEAARASVPQMIVMFKDDDSLVYEPARLGLANFGVIAVPALIDLLRDPDNRAAAAAVLGDIGPEAEAAVPALARALEDSDDDVRRTSADALGDIGPAAEAAVPALARALDDTDASVRSNAATALGDLGPVARAAVPALVRALRDGDPDTRWASAEALGEIGVASEAVVAGLIDALDDPGAWVPMYARDGLKALGPEAIPAVIGALSDLDPEVRRLAAEVLGSYGSGAQAAIPALEALLDDPNMSIGVRWTVGVALSRIREDDAPSG